jgi:hypothetical protein
MGEKVKREGMKLWMERNKREKNEKWCQSAIK